MVLINRRKCYDLDVDNRAGADRLPSLDVMVMVMVMVMVV